MNRNIIVMFMTICLVFSLTACGGSTSQQQTESSTTKTEIQEVDIEVTEEKNSSEIEQQTEENSSAETKQQTMGKDALIVYFSATGTTKGVAEKIAEVTDADIYEIVPINPYSQEDLNYTDSQSRTSVEMNDPDARPEIEGDEISLDGYTTLYIGYPIWWGEAPRIMSTFVESYNFEGITIIPFCTSGSSSIGNSDNQLAEQSGSGTWIAGSRFSGDVSESDLQAWIDDLQ